MSELGDADWVRLRPTVVSAVASTVRGVDPEEAASRALEKMLRLQAAGTVFTEPVAYWRRAAINEGYSLVREAARATPVDDATLAALTPAAPDAPALEAQRQADVDLLRRALDGLAGSDRDLLWARHVDGRPVQDIAADLAIRPHAATTRLRRAEDRLAAGFAAAHAALTQDADCRVTRAAMHPYVKGRLSGRRRGQVEAHLDTCQDCTRAFVDVREASWGLRALAPWLLVAPGVKAAVVAAGLAGGVVGGVSGAAAGGAAGRVGWLGRPGPVVAGAVVAVVVAAGFASAMVAHPHDDAPSATGAAPQAAAQAVTSGASSQPAASFGVESTGTSSAGTSSAGTSSTTSPGTSAGVASAGGASGPTLPSAPMLPAASSVAPVPEIAAVVTTSSAGPALPAGTAGGSGGGSGGAATSAPRPSASAASADGPAASGGASASDGPSASDGASSGGASSGSAAPGRATPGPSSPSTVASPPAPPHGPAAPGSPSSSAPSPPPTSAPSPAPSPTPTPDPTPTTPTPTSSPDPRTTTVRLVVGGRRLAPGTYRVVPSAGARVASVRTTGWGVAAAGDVVRVGWWPSPDASVVVEVVGPSGSSATLVRSRR